jgi:hypothetical protein
VLELCEDEGSLGYLGDAAGAGRDVLEGGAPLGEQGEPAFSPAAELAQQRIAGAVPISSSYFPAGFSREPARTRAERS